MNITSVSRFSGKSSAESAKKQAIEAYAQGLRNHELYPEMYSACTKAMEQVQVADHLMELTRSKETGLLQTIRESQGAAREACSRAYEVFRTKYLLPIQTLWSGAQLNLELVGYTEPRNIERAVAKQVGLKKPPTAKDFAIHNVDDTGVIFWKAKPTKLPPFTQIEGGSVLHIPIRHIGNPVLDEVLETGNFKL